MSGKLLPYSFTVDVVADSFFISDKVLGNGEERDVIPLKIFYQLAFD